MAYQIRSISSQRLRQQCGHIENEEIRDMIKKPSAFIRTFEFSINNNDYLSYTAKSRSEIMVNIFADKFNIILKKVTGTA
jgi:hypothetical protein